MPIETSRPETAPTVVVPASLSVSVLTFSATAETVQESIVPAATSGTVTVIVKSSSESYPTKTGSDGDEVIQPLTLSTEIVNLSS